MKGTLNDDQDVEEHWKRSDKMKKWQKCGLALLGISGFFFWLCHLTPFYGVRTVLFFSGHPLQSIQNPVVFDHIDEAGRWVYQITEPVPPEQDPPEPEQELEVLSEYAVERSWYLLYFAKQYKDK
ncbi:hypothetical protein UAS_01814 [Enterococcus asini ATCC 700915]|uniref:Uncharacterized protein n=2 Tax=Enterococcus asini TaxID=57732 RepID=R2RYL9_9ENTE|nr:hypothetical protein UAS_01814 [Enterococcus asini ATCC 700915]EOT57727.1 hypothetical protein I579_01278 [Enterococcus asini ATCC 700915]OJG10480.1 hypothetical protein RU94_GL000603 [Enterococcus asini]